MHLDGKTDKYRDKLMFELYHWRNLLRKENARIHPKGHPSHGTSIFDPFTIHKGTDDNGNPTLTFKKQDTSIDYRISIPQSEASNPKE